MDAGDRISTIFLFPICDDDDDDGGDGDVLCPLPHRSLSSLELRFTFLRSTFHCCNRRQAIFVQGGPTVCTQKQL